MMKTIDVKIAQNHAEHALVNIVVIVLNAMKVIIYQVHIVHHASPIASNAVNIQLVQSAVQDTMFLQHQQDLNAHVAATIA